MADRLFALRYSAYLARDNQIAGGTCRGLVVVITSEAGCDAAAVDAGAIAGRDPGQGGDAIAVGGCGTDCDAVETKVDDRPRSPGIGDRRGQGGGAWRCRPRWRFPRCCREWWRPADDEIAGARGGAIIGSGVAGETGDDAIRVGAAGIAGRDVGECGDAVTVGCGRTDGNAIEGEVDRLPSDSAAWWPSW